MPRGVRAERGSAIVELVWLAVILLVPVVWIVMSVFEVQSGAFGVEAAARSAARAYVLAPDDASGRARAEAAVRVALADQGLPPGRFDLRVDCGGFENCHSGTAVVTVVVKTTVDLPMLPDILGSGAPAFALDASHSVPVGRFQEISP
ncbi:hypothetical protein [Nocardioides acrostichi]|uniref:TadE-like protein n=1 Tax=Nocardioides acrostichi TaxID=2784339 RepID=A0A930YBD0_9ACTN|nr:hypothetical protein [Nocardioides acrostichi]MBF4162338.1 hypothetical protein [Nocardioides acrostichi]